MKLNEAIKLYRQEERAISNSYAWFRKDAKAHGGIYIGNTFIPTTKTGNVWYVEDQKFHEGIESYRQDIVHKKQLAEELKLGIIHAPKGETVSVEGGGYTNYGDFRFVWSDVAIARAKSSGEWYCNKCNQIAKTENNKPECHTCSDWNGRGRACTLSRVYCLNCQTTLNYTN